MVEANHQRLAGAIWVAFRDCGIEQILPEAVRDELNSRWRQSVASSAMTHRDIKNLHELFLKAQLEWILLKGPTVADFLYSDPASRPMVDIDILVKRKDLFRAINLLQEAGWALRGDMHPRYIRITHAVLIKEDPLVSLLEVHHNLLGTVPIPREDLLWKDVEPFAIEGCQVNALSAIDRVIHLAVHCVMGHGLKPASQLMDIRLALERLDREGWEKLVARAVSLNVSEELRLALTEVKARQGYTPPDHYFRQICEVRVGRLKKKAVSLAISDAGGHSGMTLARLILIPGLGAKLEYAAFVFFPPKQWLKGLSREGRSTGYIGRLFSGLARAMVLLSKNSKQK